MDEIFLVNSSSFQDVEISASLRAGLGIIVDFTQAAIITGSFSGRGDQLVQVSASYIIPEANATASFSVSSSFAIEAISASHAGNVPETASYAMQALTASYVDDIEPSSASWASSSISASHATNADTAYAINFVPLTTTSASWVSASAKITTADTASYIDAAYVVGTVTSASYSISASWAPIDDALNAVSSSWVSASVKITTADTASYVLAANVSGKVATAGTADTASYVISSNIDGTVVSASHATTASYATNATPTVSSSWASASISAQSASFIIPGATFYQVSGSDGYPPAYIEPYDYSPESAIYQPPYKAGRIFWDNQYNDWAWYATTGSGATSWRSHLGKEVSFGVHNPYPYTLTRLSAVYIGTSSVAGQYQPDVYFSIADGTGQHAYVDGVIRNDIPSGSNGFMLQSGVMHRTNMGSFALGDTLWLSTTTPGGLTKVEPGQPNEQVRVGYCSEAGTSGSFICDRYTLPIPANAYAGMTSVPTITDSLNSASADFTQSLYIGAATVNLYSNTSGIGVISGYPLLPVTVSVPVGGNVIYVYAKLDGTTASYATTTDFSSINQTTKVPVAVTYRADVDAHWVSTNQEGLALANKLNQRLESTERFTRENGLVLNASGSYITVTDGNVWIGATRFTEHSFDSRLTGSDFQSGSFNELHFAHHSASTWVVPISTNGTYNTNYYDNGTNLIPLGPLSYSLNYVFRIFGENNEYDEDVFYLTSNYQYSSVPEAKADVLPADVPILLSEIGLLLGRLIVQSGSANAILVESAFANTFGTSIINNHNNLAGLRGGLDYYHLTTAEYTGTGTGVFVKQSGATLTNAIISGSITTASYVAIANTANTASYVITANTASYVVTANTASFVLHAVTASFVSSIASASYADTSSWAINAINGGTQISTGSTYPITASVAVLATTATTAGTANTASYILAANVSGKVSTAGTADTASYVQATNIAGTLTATQAPLAISSSWVSASNNITTADTASYVQATNIAGTLTATQAPLAVSASWVSASNKITTADTASYVQATNIAGTLTATQAPLAISASWVSASVKITTADTASYVLASNVSGKVSTATTADTASFLTRNRTYQITSSWAETASIAITASHVPGASLNGTVGYVPVYNSTTTLSATSSIFADGKRMAIGSASFDPTDPDVLVVWGRDDVDSNSIAAFYHNTNSYAQAVVQNRGAGATASGDWIAQSNVPVLENLGYADFGINNTGYADPAYNIGGPLDSYLYAYASGSVGGNLNLGCDTSGKQIQFTVGGFAISNQIMQISDTIRPNVQITGSLQVTQGITGSLLGTASWASSAITASYVSMSFTKGGTFYDPIGLAGTAAASQNVTIWRAPFACTVTNLWGLMSGGTNDTASVNAQKNNLGTLATGSHIVITTLNTWFSASSLITTSFSAGDSLQIMLITSSGYPTAVSVQIDFKK